MHESTEARVMGKIINSTFVSIDGVINHMEAWHFAYIDGESEQIALEQLQASEAMLIPGSS
ncbi:MAG TPA: hypothetical protein VH641_04605 [Streptosporangiaceae bacterium]